MADWEVELFEEKILNSEFASVGCILSCYERILRLLKIVISLELGDKLSSETIYAIRAKDIVRSMATDIFNSYRRRMAQRYVHDQNDVDRFFAFISKILKHAVRYRNLVAHIEVREGRKHEISPLSTSLEAAEPDAGEEVTALFDVSKTLNMNFVEEIGGGKLRMHQRQKSDVIEVAIFFWIAAENLHIFVEEMQGDVKDEGCSPFDAFCATYEAFFGEELFSELEVFERIEKKLERKWAHIKDLDYESAYPW